jgi:hypothetical protein
MVTGNHPISDPVICVRQVCAKKAPAERRAQIRTSGGSSPETDGRIGQGKR